MDPYIEARGPWGDFHHKLIGEIERALSAQVPERYLVRVEERSYVALAGLEGKEERTFLPDVRVSTAPSKPRKRSQGRSTTAAEPEIEDAGAVTVQAFVAEEHREAFIEIFEDDPERRLVTCIEVLSPSNKRKKSKGRRLYLRKRQSLLLGTANFVEIDLLRGGERMPMLGTWPDSPYTILVCREHRAPYCKVWPAHYREPLPTLPVPLLRPDRDIRIDLQPLIAGIYARSRYHLEIDYRKPLGPPLAEADAAWLAGQLKRR
jgi:hypothetical protein